MNLFPRLRIAQKLPLALVGSALVVSAGVGLSSYFIGLSTVQQQRDAAMQASLATASSMVNDYFKSAEVDLRLFVQRSDTVTAMKNLDRAFNELRMGLGEKASLQLQAAYVTENPNPEDRAALDSAGAKGATYDAPHKRFHPGFRTLMQERGYSDVLLISAAGDIVYSVAKNGDFARNVLSDPELMASGLGQAFAAAKDLPDGEAAFIDFSLYGPAGQPESFMAMPIYEKDESTGVMLLAISAAPMSARIADLTGLGKSGEVVVVGQDGLLRSESSHTEVEDVLATTLTADVVSAAFAGGAGEGISTDYRNARMVVRAAPVSVGQVQWAVAAVQPEDEALAPVVEMRNMTMMVGGGLLLVAALLSMLFARSISRPISRLTDTMDALAAGDLSVEVKGASRSDEIGAMARAVEVFRENGLKVSQMTEAEAARIVSTQAERAAMMQDLQRAFGAVVDAAIAGDFTRRVDAEFPDEELNALARSVNELVETVDRGVADTGAVLSSLAEADLTHRMQGDYRGAFARLQADTNAVADKLAGIVGQLKDTSGLIKTATGEILSGANDLSERTTKQAATIEETSAAMEQLASTVMRNAGQAQDASSAASGVTRTAEEGGQVMEAATQAMERITQSSAKISNIIGLIDDIAFQTNLLASTPPSKRRGRRSGQGLCRGCRGSAAPGAVGRQCLGRGQGADRAERQRGFGRYAARFGCRRQARDHAGRGPRLERTHDQHCPRKPGAGLGHRGGQCRRPPDGRDDPAQCRPRRGDECGHRADRVAGHRTRPDRRRLRARRGQAGPGRRARAHRRPWPAAEAHLGGQVLSQPRQCSGRQRLVGFLSD